MRKVHIFIAGAKDLSEQRTKLKALITDINHRNNTLGSPVIFDSSSYETCGNDQLQYNERIQDADVVIFVLQDRIGKYTEDEYLLAKKLKASKRIPEVVVMLKSYTELTPEISYINGLMKDDNYYITYNNDDDLILKTKNYLEEYVKHPRPRRLGRFRLPKLPLKYKLLVVSLLTVLLLIVGFVGGSIHQSRQKILLIAGGGSAKNFIEKNYGIDLTSYHNSCYVHLPSKNAWQLLVEEVISPMQSKRYCPVCISAQEAMEEDFTKITTKEAFLEKGHVVAKKLECNDKDTLVVSIKNDPYIVQLLGQESIDSCWISMDDFLRLVASGDSVNLFATSKDSGTRSAYERAFANAQANMDDWPMTQYSEDTQFAKVNIDDKPYVLLGSQNYIMREVQNEVDNARAFNLRLYRNVDGGKQFYTKPMYIYFFIDKDNSWNGGLYVGKPVLQLLKDLGCDLTGKVKNNCVRPNVGNAIIQDFDNLRNW